MNSGKPTSQVIMNAYTIKITKNRRSRWIKFVEQRIFEWNALYPPKGKSQPKLHSSPQWSSYNRQLKESGKCEWSNISRGCWVLSLVPSYIDIFLWKSWFLPQSPTIEETFKGFILALRNYDSNHNCTYFQVWWSYLSLILAREVQETSCMMCSSSAKHFSMESDPGGGS